MLETLSRLSKKIDDIISGSVTINGIMGGEGTEQIGKHQTIH